MAIKALEKEFELDPEEYGFPMTEIRFVLVDTETGEIVDDAQGYGYKTAHGAHKAYGWKNSKRRNNH